MRMKIKKFTYILLIFTCSLLCVNEIYCKEKDIEINPKETFTVSTLREKVSLSSLSSILDIDDF